MDRVTVDQGHEIVKTSTGGYNEAIVLAYDRHELMDAYAEYLLLVTPPVEPQGAVGVWVHW